MTYLWWVMVNEVLSQNCQVSIFNCLMKLVQPYLLQALV